MVEMLRAGTKSRRQALIFMITNSGADRTSVCWDYHAYAVSVAAGQVQDDSFFGYVCALDATDDPFKDESCWIKVNPSLEHGLPGMKYLREQVTQARGIPSKESVVRRLNFCQWVDAASPWIGYDVWAACKEADVSPALLDGRRCWGGLDLGSTQDLTGLALVFEPTDADPVWRLKTWAWLPEEGLADKADRDRVPYLAWRGAGHIETTPGRAISKLAVARRLAEITASYDLQDVAYDRWRIEDLKMILEQEGISVPLSPFGQGFKDMAPAVDEFERRLLSRELRHDGNPVLTWCAANAVTVTDPAGNRKVAKEKATGRVDLIVAALMAVGRSLSRPVAPAYVGVEVW
jgi:phage terminase large subunit-like protein